MFSFSRLARLPLRRCLHTGAGSAGTTNSFGRTARIALGASAVSATYVTWQLTRERNATHCDAPQASKSTETLPKAKLSRPTSAPSDPTPPAASTSTAEGDIFVPDAPSENSTILEVEADSEGEDETSPDGSAAAGGGGGGAYNPETGEINWDCPCLGGMAHGPCGPEFREAFSCFIYSEDEPKGINCVDKFQNMQNCFRAHPDVYGDEIMRDEEDDEAPAGADGSSDVPPAEHLTEEQLAGDATSSTKDAPLEDAAVANTV